MNKLFKSLLIIATFATISFAQEKLLTFQVQTINNKSLEVTEAKNGLDFKDFRGKVVLLEFWGTHCPPCLMSIPHYIKLTKEYKDKIAMVAVEVQGTPKEQLAKFVQAKGINYYVAPHQDNYNFVEYVAQRSGWKGPIPYLIILDTQGNVIDIKVGFASENYVKSIIEYALKKANEPTKKENNTTKDSNQTINNQDKNSTKQEKNTTK